MNWPLAQFEVAETPGFWLVITLLFATPFVISALWLLSMRFRKVRLAEWFLFVLFWAVLAWLVTSWRYWA